MTSTPELTEDQIRAWCAYLAALHTASSYTVQLPFSPKCPRSANGMDGCGTCYGCMEQLIMRGVFCTSMPTSENAAHAWRIANSVYHYVARLDPERLTIENGDDFAPMTGEQFARVMNWAATMIPTAARHSALTATLAPAAKSAADPEPAKTW